jgi:methyl-accepting chemotaxis protein
MLNGLKIGPKLIGGFLIVALIAAVIGIIGTINIKDIANKDTVLYEKAATPLKDLVIIGVEFEKIRVSMWEMLNANNEETFNEKVKEINEARNLISTAQDDFEKNIIDEKLKKEFEGFKESRKVYGEDVDKIIELAKMNKIKEAEDFILNEADKTAREEEIQIDSMETELNRCAKELSDNNAKTANAASMIMILSLILGVIIAITLGIFITLSITRPVNKVVQAARKIAEEDLSNLADVLNAASSGDFSRLPEIKTQELTITSKDEVGILANTFNQMIAKFKISGKAVEQFINAVKALTIDANMLSKAAVDGKLDTRADASKHNGDFRKIVQGVNDTLDAVIGPLNVAAEYVDRISKGDIPQHITDTYHGDFNEIKNNLNQCIDAVDALIADANILSKAAVDGKLDTRADASKHNGDFRKIVQGVNETLDAVIGPLNVAAEYVDRISKGDIPQKITDNYNGDFNEIKNNLNQCIDAVNALVSDANILSKAAVEGKLATRADASKHQGDFRKIVQGVNDCLDAVIGPLNVAANYVDRISKGDIPEKIVDKYNGDFNTIKNNLNTCIEAVNKLVADANMLSVAAVEGKLATRADASKHQGDFRKIVQGVDDCLDAVIGPLNVAAKYVDDISKGNIPAKITDNYNGDFNTIKNNLNQCIDAVNALVADANMLSKAAVEGKLATRADASKHNGDFRNVVDGVNNTLDAVITPINEAQSVLEKVAARDLTIRVNGDYKGDMAKMKAAINSAVDNLDKALQQVTEATEQVTSAGGQISSGSQSLAQGANEQASSLEEVSSSLEEMASMTKQNADNANQAKGLAAESDTNAKAGAEAMDRMSNAINRIKESSDQTAKIVKTIDEIAMQTNLLALNAAVEAARAGEAGRGFAVVAEEVRNLAQRSAQAAKNTADMITESVKNADDGVKIATEVSQSFETIAGSAKKVNDLIAEIAAASQEQSSGIEQINTAVAQMDKVTQQNAANSEESASAAEELSSQAEELKNMISQFVLSQSMVSVSTPRKMAAAHTLVHAPVKDKSNYKAIGKKPTGKTTSIKPEDIIPLDDEALKEF